MASGISLFPKKTDRISSAAGLDFLREPRLANGGATPQKR
jgi:hypothetical protein